MVDEEAAVVAGSSGLEWSIWPVADARLVAVVVVAADYRSAAMALGLLVVYTYSCCWLDLKWSSNSSA